MPTTWKKVHPNLKQAEIGLSGVSISLARADKGDRSEYMAEIIIRIAEDVNVRQSYHFTSADIAANNWLYAQERADYIADTFLESIQVAARSAISTLHDFTAPRMVDVAALPNGTTLCLEDELVSIREINGVRGIFRNPPDAEFRSWDYDPMKYLTPFDPNPEKNFHMCSHIERPRRKASPTRP